MSPESPGPSITVRLARADDLSAINDIYNYFVLHSTATYQTEPETLPARQAWFAHHGPAHPITVAQDSTGIVGWGSLSPYHPRAAWGQTVENSIYVHHEHHRRGIGRLLLKDLIDRATTAGHHTIIAGISADQTASVRLHESVGFVEAARLREVGRKFGRWLDVVYLQLLLSSTSIPPTFLG